ncbi:MAG: hypothetical protein OXQ29_00965 [Rhodospirillaceae bacterium]|nr:hypothetical protein [Rhodospirillaceae bacterium]
MSPSERINPGTGNKTSKNRNDARRPRSIRFADSEWNLIEQAALRHGIAAGELVRTGALALAEDRLGESPPATLTSGHLALIEATYRASFVSSIIDKERLLENRPEKDVNKLVDAARVAMEETMKEGPA